MRSIGLVELSQDSFDMAPHGFFAQRQVDRDRAAAILGMLPIAHEVFWGPMAYAVIGGLAVATLLTLIFLPALYAAWFRVREAPPEPRSAAATPA